jgi:hypothetical protein
LWSGLGTRSFARFRRRSSVIALACNDACLAFQEWCISRNKSRRGSGSGSRINQASRSAAAAPARCGDAYRRRRATSSTAFVSASGKASASGTRRIAHGSATAP